jgi:hypothetical protein
LKRDSSPNRPTLEKAWLAAFVALRVPVDLVPVAVSAEPFTLQAVVYFPHHIEWPIAHLARVPNNVVSGEVNSDTNEDCPTVRFRCPAADGRDDCRHHQS